MFNAFNLTPLSSVKIVILGQDPYHGAGQAMGLSFSVPKTIPKPPSLNNILKEMADDIGTTYSRHGDLTHWARQGVLLLNSSLSVEAGQAGSHQGKGWEQFTDAVIEAVNQQTEHTVFILWGSHAKKKGKFIDTDKHLILIFSASVTLVGKPWWIFWYKAIFKSQCLLKRTWTNAD